MLWAYGNLEQPCYTYELASQVLEILPFRLAAAAHCSACTDKNRYTRVPCAVRFQPITRRACPHTPVPPPLPRAATIMQAVLCSVRACSPPHLPALHTYAAAQATTPARAVTHRARLRARGRRPVPFNSSLLL